MTHLRYLHIGVLVSLWWEAASPYQPWPVPPRDIMADITNDLGVCLLQVMTRGDSARENIAFSPYGVLSVVFLLYEGSHGNSGIEIYNTLRLPWDRHMSRIGFRDLHRHIKSYFSNDRFLKGLVLSKPSVPLRNEYVRLLNFYGFYPNRDGVPGPPSRPVYLPTEDSHGRNPITTTDYYPTEKVPIYTTPVTIIDYNDYTTQIVTNTPRTFATFPSFETEPTPPPYDPTKSSSKTTPQYSTFDQVEATQSTIDAQETTTRFFRKTTTMKPFVRDEITTVTPGYNGHGMTQFIPGNTMTPTDMTGPTRDDRPTLNDNVILPDEDPRQTTKLPQGRTEPFSETETYFTQSKTTLSTEPTTVDEDQNPADSSANDVEGNVITSTATTSEVVHFPTDDSNAEGESTDIDVRLGNLEKSSTLSIERMDRTSVPPETTRPLTTNQDSTTERLTEPIITNEISSTERQTESMAESPSTERQMDTIIDSSTTERLTDRTGDESPTERVADTNIEVSSTEGTSKPDDETTSDSELISTVDVSRKNSKLIMTRKDVEEANEIVETMDKSRMNETSTDFKPTLATILSTIGYASMARSSDSTESSVRVTSTAVELQQTIQTTSTPPPATSQSSVTFTNLRMPISREMAATRIDLSVNATTESQQEINATERWKRSLVPPELPYDHRDGSTNWIPAADGPHWEYSVPRDQWFFTYSGGQPVPVLTYSDYLPFAIVETIDAMALQLPLDDPRYSMLILLPVERYGLEQLLDSLNQCTIRDILQSLRIGSVYAVIPAFTLVKHVDIVPPLTSMGVEEVFDPLRSDLSGMADEPHLYVRSIEQLVTVSLRKYHYSSRRYEGRLEEINHRFIANHPFVYFVLDTETNAALMAGTIVNPTSSSSHHHHHPDR